MTTSLHNKIDMLNQDRGVRWRLVDQPTGCPASSAVLTDPTLLTAGPDDDMESDAHKPVSSTTFFAQDSFGLG